MQKLRYPAEQPFYLFRPDEMKIYSKLFSSKSSSHVELYRYTYIVFFLLYDWENY